MRCGGRIFWGAFWLVVATTGETFAEPNFQLLAPKWIASGETTTELDLIIESVASEQLLGTQYEGRIRINQPLAADYLNFYILEPDAAKEALAKGNCAAFVEAEAIVCDAHFFNKFVTTINNNAEAESDPDIRRALLDLQAQYSDFLATWLLGHEMAHVVLGHTTTGEPGSAEEQWGSPQEKDADTLVLTHLPNSPLQFSAFMTLSQMATSIYLQVAEHQYTPEEIQAVRDRLYSFGTPLTVTLEWRTGRHPPWLIRVLDLYEILLAYYPRMVDSSEYMDRLRERVVRADETVVGSPEPDWDADTPILGHPDWSPRFGYSVNGEAEQLDLLLMGYPDLALVKADDFAVRASEQFPEPRLGVYLSWIRLDAQASLGVDVGPALDAVEASYQTIPPDLSLALLRARTIARLSPDSEAKRAAAQENIAAISELAAAQEISRRDTALINVDIWEITARSFGLQDQLTLGVTEEAIRALADTRFLLPKDRFLSLWHQLIRNESEAVSDTDTANQLLYFAEAASSFGRTVDAAAAIEKALTILRSLPDKQLQYPVLAYWANRQSQIYRSLDMWEEAGGYAEEALNYRRRWLARQRTYAPEDEDHANGQVAAALNEYGYALLLQERYTEARAAFEEALHIISEVTVEDFWRATITHNLAQTEVALGMKQQALKDAQFAFSERVRIGAAPVQIEDSRGVLAAAHYLNGDLDMAKKLMRQNLANLKAINDSDEPTASRFFIVNGEEIPLDVLAEVSVPSPETSTGSLRIDQNLYSQMISSILSGFLF